MAGEANNGSGKRTVRIGVFIPTECQLLDAASVDIMGSMGHEYMTMISHSMPKVIIDLAPSVEIHYIGSVKAGETIKLTSNETIVATNRFSDPEVAPGKLDIILVPGPDPTTKFPEDSIAWLRAQGDTPGVDILSVCTGIFICGQAGLLRGKNVCGPRALQDMIRAKGFGEKALLGDKYRWIQDGNFWSSGGVTNGNDLVAAYARASPHFPNPVVEIACEMTDVGDRPRAYEKELIDFPEFVKGVIAAAQ